MKLPIRILALFAIILLVGCSTVIKQSPQSQRVSGNVNWGIVPMANYTQTPLAGQKVAAITAGILQTSINRHVYIYKAKGGCENVLACPNQKLTKSQIRAWARKKHIQYVVMGSVNEWRYKVGLDGEPAVSMTLNLMNVSNRKSIWNAVGSKTGGSRGGLGTIGQKLIHSMLSNLTIE